MRFFDSAKETSQGWVFPDRSQLRGGGLVADTKSDPASDSKQVLKVLDSNIVYEVKGQGDVTILFVHGWTCDRQFWKYQIDYFAQSYQVVYPDLSGHGESVSQRQRYSMAAFAEDVVAVVNDIGASKVVLVGHSMGAPVAVEAARILGKKALLVVGVDFFYSFGLEHLYRRKIAQPIVATRKNLAFYLLWPITGVINVRRRLWLKFVKKNLAANIKRLVKEVMFSTGTDPDLVTWIVNRMSAADADMAISAINELIDWRNHKQPAALQAVKSKLYNINAAETEHEQLSDDSVTLIRGTGHFIPQVKPNSFNKTLHNMVISNLENSKSHMKSAK